MSMKKFTTLALAGLVATSAAVAQRPGQQTYVASPSQMTKSVQNVKGTMLFHDMEQGSIVKAQPIHQGPTVSPNGKVAAVSPVALGSAGNAFTCLRTEQTQIYANNETNLVHFMHRNNQNVYGGSSGNLRYDVSIDGGVTFNNDIGPVNPTMTLPARYPQAVVHNPAGNTNPLNAHHVGYSPTLGTPTWDGHVATSTTIVTSGSPTVNGEDYLFGGDSTLLPGGLCRGLPGEYWSVDFLFDGTNAVGPITTHHGTWNTGTNKVDWVAGPRLSPNHYTGFDGTVTAVGPNISFSPDGSVGWIAWLGDLAGDGVDSTYLPCFSKTTDNGATWSTPVCMNLNSVPWVADSLQSLWVDSLGNPASSGRATCAFDFDLTVDGNGNPHLAVVVGSGTTTAAPDPAYSIYSGLAKFLADVHSTDGGATWNALYISPVLAFRTQTFGATASTVTMDNFPQISRSADGQL
jgi:Neuraminidase (sialidase)